MTTENFELDVHSLSHDGRAVGRYDDMVVFVRGALPGQRVRVAISSKKKRFAEADCVEVLSEAPDAVPAACPHASVCGGCPLQQMPYATQLQWKEKMLVEALTRIGKADAVPMEGVTPSPAQWGYRNKMEFAFSGGNNADDPLVLGLRGGASHTVVDVRQCKLMPDGAMDVLDTVRALASATGLPAFEAEHAGDRDEKRGSKKSAGTAKCASRGKGFWRHVVLRMPVAPGPGGAKQILVSCITAPGNDEQRALVAAMGKKLFRHGVTGFVHEERSGAALVAQGEDAVLSLGETILRESLGGINYSVDHGGFFQVNTGAAEMLCAKVLDMADMNAVEDGAVLWDVYCGVGAPGLALAAAASRAGRTMRLCGVESHSGAVAMARRNAEEAGLRRCGYDATDARKVLSRWAKPEVVLVDPPRVGLHSEVIDALLKAAPRRIVYVSCNPATLARDVALLCHSNTTYTLKRVAAVDLFPQTAHVECVALLTKNKKR